MKQPPDKPTAEWCESAAERMASVYGDETTAKALRIAALALRYAQLQAGWEAVNDEECGPDDAPCSRCDRLDDGPRHAAHGALLAACREVTT